MALLLRVFLGSAVRLSSGQCNRKREHNSRMFTAASEALQRHSPGLTRCKHTRNKSVLPLVPLSRDCAVTLCLFNVNYSQNLHGANVFAFKGRLNNRLHLHWYCHKRHFSAGCSIICGVTDFTYHCHFYWMMDGSIYFSLYVHRHFICEDHMCIYYLLRLSDFDIWIFIYTAPESWTFDLFYCEQFITIINIILDIISLPQMNWLYIAGYLVWGGINNRYCSVHNYLLCELQLHHKTLIRFFFHVQIRYISDFFLSPSHLGDELKPAHATGL